jgi:hydroxylamine reductase
LGEIDGIPRVLDAGQYNDSYSLVLTAMKLRDLFGLKNINDLPISYNIAWYEQKAVLVLLALLSLGVRNINLGPTLPGFLSPKVTELLVDKFNLGTISQVQLDLKKMVS